MRMKLGYLIFQHRDFHLPFLSLLWGCTIKVILCTLSTPTCLPQQVFLRSFGPLGYTGLGKVMVRQHEGVSMSPTASIADLLFSSSLSALLSEIPKIPNFWAFLGFCRATQLASGLPPLLHQFSVFLVLIRKLALIPLLFSCQNFIAVIAYLFFLFAYAQSKAKQNQTKPNKKNPLLLCQWAVGVEGSESVQFTSSEQRLFTFLLNPCF